jgi:hypothetical protein
MRICLPVFLWTIVVIATPAFVNQISRQDRASQEDFAVYYFSALEMRNGINPYSTNFARSARGNGLAIHSIEICTDPPTFVAIFELLTYFPLHTAYLLWQAINLACMVGAVLLLLGSGSGLSVSTCLTLTALTALYPPVASHLWFGQSKFPLLLLLVLMIRAMKRGNDSMAGVALAIATLLRAFPIAIAGYLILQRRWRALAYLATSLAIGLLLTAAFVGAHNTLSFFANIPGFSGHAAAAIQRDLAMNFFISRELLAVYPYPGEVLNLTRIALIVAADFIVIVATTRVTLMLPAREDPDYRLFSLWVATAVILLPIAWDYDLVLMLIPFSQLAIVTARREASRRAIAMAILSYLLLIWWEYVALSANEFGFFSMITAYLSAYWLATDQPDAVSIPLLSLPAALFHRLIVSREAPAQVIDAGESS